MIVAVVGAVVGIQTLSFLLNAAGVMRTSGAAGAASAPDWSRRGFLIRAGGVAVASTVAGVVGRRLLDGSFSAGSQTAGGTPVTLPAPVETATLPGGRRDPPGRHHPARRAERRLLPDRHVPDPAQRRRRHRGGCASTGWSTTR